MVLPSTVAGRVHVYHIYAIRTPRRDDLMRHLSQQGISSGIHYPIPVHLQNAYAKLGMRRNTFPIAERCADEFVSLPMYPELTLAQVEAVATAVTEWTNRSIATAPAT
jgi:dTDP-4-amino-4,6-dideoxygalactose transaminase